MPDETLAHISFRRAERSDLPTIVGLLADDHLGAQRERLEAPLPESYDDAFATINADPNQYLLVAADDDRVVGYLLLSFLRGISRQGAWHARINEVRVTSTLRSHGIGRKMIEHVVEIARRRGCGIMELTTHKSRRDAFRFYERLGFIAAHEGMSMILKP